MTFESFKEKYATTMMWYQLIENDLKYIYSFMLEGSVEKNYGDIENNTLGTMVRMLERLDYSDGSPYISKADYKFLLNICDKRNYWAHQAFVDFAYIKNPFSSKEYRKVSDCLAKDCEEVERACSILEKMRIEYCKNHER